MPAEAEAVRPPAPDAVDFLGVDSLLTDEERAISTSVQFGGPIGRFQLTQQKLVDMLVELNKAQLLALHLGRLKDDGKLR